MKSASIRRFYFFGTGVANDRLRNFPSRFGSNRMKKRLVRNVFASFYILPLLSLISPPFVAIEEPGRLQTKDPTSR
jgi:hypothetical protein